MSKHKFLDNLNPEQRRAVFLEDRNSLILAGAGSGKTKVLTSRIAYLCREGQVSLDNVLAVTFTNKAAKEIQIRVSKMLGTSTFGMWIGTFHGIAYRLLRKHAHELGLDKHFKIIDQDEQAQLIKRVIKKLDLNDKKYCARKCCFSQKIYFPNKAQNTIQEYSWTMLGHSQALPPPNCTPGG